MRRAEGERADVTHEHLRRVGVEPQETEPGTDDRALEVATYVLNGVVNTKLLAAFNGQAGGSSGRVARLLVMTAPPSLDTGEMTDKGSINQRAVLTHRAPLVDDLYATPSPAHVISPATATPPHAATK